MKKMARKANTNPKSNPVEKKTSVSEKQDSIFVLGDRIEDFILIAERNHPNVNSNLNYDLFTRDVIDSDITYSGVDALEKLISEYYKGNGNIAVVRNSSKDINSKTVSEWRKEKISDELCGDGLQNQAKEGTNRLFLEKHIGLTEPEKRIVLTQTDVSKLKKAKTVVIYNMIAEIFTNKDKKPDINSLLCNAKSIIVRTKFLDGQKYTSLVSEISKDQAIAGKTVLICNVNELRRGGFNIRKGISWEQLLNETNNAIESIKGIKKFKAVIVCFNHEGCIVYEHKNEKTTLRELHYYCDEIEGDFVIKEHKRVFSPIITMQTVITVLSEEGCSISSAAKIGLIMMREIIRHGFNGSKPSEYPYDHIVNEIKKWEGLDKKTIRDDKLLSVTLTDEVLDDSFTLLNHQLTSINKNYLDFAKTIVTEGPLKANAPYLRYHKLLTFDRTEIEQLRSIHQIFKQYITDLSIEKPLSICVFGQPGSGKSFTVKQIAKTLNINNDAILEYNLSQMTTIQELMAAFHQIRDAGLKGSLPLAFFDEFDSPFGSSDYGWLKYFLAPMQDGEFRENNIAHFIGRAIFVFAGGTCKSTNEFMTKEKEDNAINNKLPDFLSRVKGYIDVSGPNPSDCSKSGEEGTPADCWIKSRNYKRFLDNNGKPSEAEKFFSREEILHIDNCEIKQQCCQNETHLLRRATLLRSMLQVKMEKKDGDEIGLDSNVLSAFLEVRKYLHGARSMEAIVQMSDVSSSLKFTSSNILNHYLDLYVTKDFDKLLSHKSKS